LAQTTTGNLANETAKFPYYINQVPISNAGSDQTAKAGNIVTLNGGGSRDPDGDKLNYYWMQTAGKNVALSANRISNPTFTAPSVTTPTVLKFGLIVDDGKLSSHQSAVNVMVQPRKTSYFSHSHKVVHLLYFFAVNQ